MAAKILLVDDEPDVLYVLSTYLERAGFAVVKAGSAEAAIPLAESVDAVVMDIEMGGVSGMLAVVAMLKKTKAPIFLMTGHADLEIEKDALLLGAKGLLRKPLDPAALKAELEKALRR